ncbi:unnamed protein product [Chrysoparadoxa australica]
MGEWTRHLDKASGQLYLYNVRTGETQWEKVWKDDKTVASLGSRSTLKTCSCSEGGTDSDTDADIETDGDSDGDKRTTMHRFEQKGSGGSSRDGAKALGGDVGVGLRQRPRPAPVDSIGKDCIDYSGNEDSDNEGAGLLHWERNLGPLDPQVAAATEPAIRAYRRAVFCHACCCEAPLAIAEGCVRAPLYCVGSAWLGFLGLLATKEEHRKRLRTERHLCLREGVLFLCAACALALPCSAFRIYRDFDPEEPWDIKPIPTGCGLVDPRRFFTYTYGQAGELAANGACSGEGIRAQSMDEDRQCLGEGGGILHPPRDLMRDLWSMREAMRGTARGEGTSRTGDTAVEMPSLEPDSASVAVVL